MAQKKIRRKAFVEPVLISVPEFSRLSGIGYTLTRQLIASGEVPTRLIGNRRWVIRAAAVAWLEKPQVA
jgi:hypothetical protein